MSSGDRLFLENQIRQFDVMGRMLMDMRSVLVRRQRLLERTPHRRPQPIRPHPAVPRRASNLVLNLQQAGANMLFDRPEGLGEVVLNMDDLLAMEDAMMAPQPPRMSRVRVRMPKKVIKVIKKADLEKSMEDVCSICQDSYVKKDSVTASCGNQFCASCFEQWIETKKMEHKAVTCPLCRQNVVSFMGYRARAARGSKNPVVEQPPPVEAPVGPP